MKVTVYTPASEIKNPLRILGGILSDLWGSRELALRFAKRNITAQYRQSILGILWAFVPTIIAASIWIFLNGEKIINISNTNIPYPVFVFVGMMLWQSFADMLNAPIQSLTENKALITKINFPREALLLAGFYQSLFNFGIKLLLIIAVMFFFGVVPDENLIFSPLAILMLFMLGQTLGILLIPISILYNDVQKAISAFINVWMFLTPVIYPEPKGSIGKLIGQYNPVAPLLTTSRNWLTGTEATSLDSFYIISAVTLIFFVLSLLLFKVSLPHLIARIGS